MSRYYLNLVVPIELSLSLSICAQQHSLLMVFSQVNAARKVFSKMKERDNIVMKPF